MRSNASILAALLLLAGCGGARSYDAYGAEAAPPPAERQDSGGLYARPPGAAYEPPAATQDRPRDLGTRPADQYNPNARQAPAIDADLAPAPAPQEAYARPAKSYDRPTYTQPMLAQTYPQSAPVADPTANLPGPRGSSQPGAGEQRYDEVGYAGVRGVAGGDANGGAVVAVAQVPPDTFVEVTSLETGRTILVLVTGTMPPGTDHLIDLSPAAARQLGASAGLSPVRVRRVVASPQDQGALRGGRPAADRVDAPPVLITALRKHLPGVPSETVSEPRGQTYGSDATASASRIVPRSARAPVRTAPVTRGGYFVQIAALSNGGNAQALAQSLHGFVKPGGGLYRVQLGPFRTGGEAEAARADAARRGYGDARVFTQN